MRFRERGTKQKGRGKAKGGEGGRKLTMGLGCSR